MFSKFFIDRPIFAAVLSIVITLAGGISLFTLPIGQYPQISPPTVSVDCNFPGASAQVVSESVATPIEQMVNGVEDMLYMSSQCTNDGSYTLSVTFRHGIDLNMAQVLVQNRVSLAMPNLPDVLKQTGVNVRKQSPDILLAIAINSPPIKGEKTGRYDQLYLSNYAVLQIKDELARMPGVSEVRLFGQRDYSMRIWVDPDKLASRGMEAGDVVRSLREQNMSVAAGQIGQPPVESGQAIQIPLSTLGRLTEVEQFEKVIVKTTPDGRVVRVKDIGRVELGAKNEDINCSVNGKPSVSLAIFQLPDANALDTADIIKAKMEELKKNFPEGVDYEIRYDTTPFISESIGEVVKTLREAILLVALVVLLFLQNWRSAVIPLVAVPVAIVGTFAAMAALGFTLNNLTLFGLVLAIGIVVDDAIVVVEAVEHHIEHGLAPREATIRAMEQVSGPVVAIGLVLTAVFVPCAFITGIVGQFFRQFALTIAVSTVISAFNSLTLSPALAALLLRPRREDEKGGALPRPAFVLLGGYLAYELLGHRVIEMLGRVLTTASWIDAEAKLWWIGVGLTALTGGLIGWVVGPWLDRLLSWFFRLFNAGFKRATTAYGRTVGGLLRLSIVVLAGYGGLLYFTYYGFTHTPTGFIPSQDMGYLLINVQLPDSTSAERTRATMSKIEGIARDTPGIRFTQANSGQSMLLSANGSNFGSMFVILDTFEKRRHPLHQKTIVNKNGKAVEEEKLIYLDSDSIVKTLREKFDKSVPEAMLTVLPPPPVRGVGRAGGFKLMIKDQGDLGSAALQKETENLISLAKEQPDPRLARPEATRGELAALARDFPALISLASPFRANVPQLFVDVNRTECMIKEVPLRSLFDSLRIYLGSLYVNDINRFGRTWQVVVQAEQQFRNQVNDVKRLKVRNARGAMVPIGTLADIREQNGPLILTRYNTKPAAPINGSAAPGVSTGQAIKIMEDLALDNLPPAMSYEWTELAFLELQAGNTAMIVFGFAVVMVFLVLAAQYESWSMPLAVIMVVPMCLLSAVIGVQVAKQDINIFTQIGFVVLVGLASKNAILIVEFAKQRREAGETPRQAALDACTLRLRPIIMTSFAFILGVVPLILSKGAGAEMRRTLGTTVFSGMLGVTLFGIFLTPVFFFVVDVVGETALFRSPFLRRVNEIIKSIVFLSPARQLIRYAITEMGKSTSRATRSRPAERTKTMDVEAEPELVEHK
ncbi:MAG: cation/multidrug efflux pump [Planctomycetota bacterium]|nr:cation/multidrug efflux pump [Planctomycetota bacterium]